MDDEENCGEKTWENNVLTYNFSSYLQRPEYGQSEVFFQNAMGM